MKRINQAPLKRTIKALPVLLASFLMVSCASIPELKILYTLPAPSEQLRGKSVALTVEDQRASRKILGRGAEEEFKGFAGNVSLTVSQANYKGFKAGIFQVPDLMREAFIRRLGNLDVKVLSEKSPGAPRLVIVLKEFSLDLVGREWRAQMSYEASLTGEKGAVATQFVNGQAERYKLIGRDSADTLMGEIFTDMVNALNLLRLFEQAGL